MFERSKRSGAAHANATFVFAVTAALGATLLLVGSRNPSASAADGWPQLNFTAVISGLSEPVHVTNAGDGSGRIFVVERAGVIRAWNGSMLSTFLDITDSVDSTMDEQGLLSVAFDPDYDSNGFFYVYYTNTDCLPDTSGATSHACDLTISKFNDTGSRASTAATEDVLLVVDHPYNNHNGGQLAFGPDDALYAGMGDGGSGNDPQNLAQDDSTLLGKLITIDTSSGAATIVAKGLRNPWRFTFDTNGDLYIADVGQGAYEEVNFVGGGTATGLNFGWSQYEGPALNPNGSATGLMGVTMPVAWYDHSQMPADCSITGGHVYRGTQFPRMAGIYFYGDFCTGKIWGLRNDGGWESQLLIDTGFSITSFGLDEGGRTLPRRPVGHDLPHRRLRDGPHPQPVRVAI